jgi:hypothetical protein
LGAVLVVKEVWVMLVKMASWSMRIKISMVGCLSGSAVPRLGTQGAKYPQHHSTLYTTANTRQSKSIALRKNPLKSLGLTDIADRGMNSGTEASELCDKLPG